MFTGIVGGVGRIVQTLALGADPSYGLRAELEAPPGLLDDVALGDSIAIDGACMTVTGLDAPARRFQVEVSAESLGKTVGLATPGPVNLEKALRANDRLGGHLVSGHIDDVGVVTALDAMGESRTLHVTASSSLARYLAVKGSIALNGVSLTVNRVDDGPQGCEFQINLIAHTLAATTLGALRAGQRVNLEIDLIARYVERMLNTVTLGR
ncbi:MAG: riboflavin synthase [Burkholderiaceae bacterium]